MGSGIHIQGVTLGVKSLKIVRRKDGITFDIKNMDGRKTVVTFIGCTVDQLAELLKAAGANVKG
jgi:hypothetical protein